MSDLAALGGHHIHRVRALGIRAVVEDGLAYCSASWRVWRDCRVFVPLATLQNCVEAGGERAAAQWENTYLPLAFESFSGYLVADEIYDGPFCILSLVDPHISKHIFYQVLDH